MTDIDMSTLRPGDIGFGPIGNTIPRWLPSWLRFMPGTLPVGVGQWLLARTSREERNIDHVFVVTEAFAAFGDRGMSDKAGIGPLIVQAMPSGAEEIEIGAERWTPEYVYVRPYYTVHNFSLDQAHRVAEAARAYIDVPYSFLDYAAITGVHLGIENGPIRRYVTTSKHMICSQLADQSMADAGFHVFDDGRLPQDVIPAEFYRALIAMPGTQVLIPGHVGWGSPDY